MDMALELSLSYSYRMGSYTILTLAQRAIVVCYLGDNSLVQYSCVQLTLNGAHILY